MVCRGGWVGGGGWEFPPSSARECDPGGLLYRQTLLLCLIPRLLEGRAAEGGGGGPLVREWLGPGS